MTKRWDEEGSAVEFRLTYDGPLFSTGNDSKTTARSDHKHGIRSAFHPQLKRLWEITPFLKNGEPSGPSALLVEQSPDVPSYKAEWLAKKHSRAGWSFVPLVSRSLNLLCSIEILFLRPTRPGAIISSGDLDGRLKTLLDALAMPDENQGYENREHTRQNNPLFVLLEDDQLVTKVSVETDQLLQYVTFKEDKNEVRLVITVRLRPYEMHLGNIQFG